MPNALYDLIVSRRTVYDFEPRSVDPEIIKQCLTAATWAPNHGLTQPWRFWVLGPKSQSALAGIHAQLRAEKKFTPGSDAFIKAYERAKKRIQSIPVVILVGQKRAQNEFVAAEDYAACACAMQNFQLAAWEQGLGSQWCSAPMVNHSATYQLLGVDSNQIELIHALFCGYPTQIPQQQRLTLDQVCHFID